MIRPSRLSRRTVLRGMGAAIALPFLDAMRPARASDDGLPRRLFFFFVPCGFHMPMFTPSRLGRDFSLPDMLSPLEPFQEELLIVSGLRNTAATPHGEGPGDHARGTASCLTAAHPVRDDEILRNGISADQIAANVLRGLTPLASVELGCDVDVSPATCDSGYSCAYQRNISWASATQPMPKETNPATVFDRLFRSSDASLSEEERAARRRRGHSILDFAKEDGNRLHARLGSSDRHKLNEYLTSVRELERRIDAPVQTACTFSDAPPSTSSDFSTHVQHMLDLVVLAFRCDLVRTGTFMLGHSASDRDYGFLGHGGGHHWFSHDGGDAGKHAALKAIGRFEMAQFAHLLQALRDADDGERPLLDSTTVLLTSEVSDGNSHSHDNLPHIVAGSGGGVMDVGQHVDVSGAEVGDLLLTLLRVVGAAPGTIGDYGTRILPQLLRSV